MLIGFVVATGVACDPAPAPAPPPRQLVVFATLFPLADIARNVGGDRVRVDWLLDLGDSINDYVLNRRDRERLAGVDLVLCDGVGRTETWARQEMDRIRETNTIASVDRVPGTNEVPADGLLYLDPVLAGRYARAVADALARRVPSQGELFRGRADAYVARIDAVTASIKPRPGAQVMVLSGLFAPMLARSGVGSVLVDADYLNLTPSDAGMIRRAAEAAGVTTLLVPFDTPPGTLTYLAEQTGLKPFTLDPLGYPNYPQHGSYLDVLRFNLEQLALATGG